VEPDIAGFMTQLMETPWIRESQPVAH
jgi:hypothetical protein